MGEGSAASARPGEPRLRRTLESAAAAPLWLGAALAAAAAVGLVAQTLALGRASAALAPGDPLGILADLRIALTHVVISAYVVAAYVAARRTGERALARLDAAPAPGALPWLWAAGALGIAVALGVALVSPGPVSFHPATWTPETAWHRLLSPFMGFWVARLLARLVIDSLALSDAARRLPALDLLDLRPLAPLVRYGLTSALLWTGLLAGFALFLVDPRYLPLFALTLSLAALGSAAALLLPAWGARRRIQEAKAEELAWCRERIRHARRALARGTAPPERERLDELVAWEARVEATPEWPFDASALTRLLLYLLIPLGSWSGGALVERLVDALLD